MNLSFRPATLDDLPAIVRLLADDFLGATREDAAEPLDERYIKAFNEISASDTNELIVALSELPASAGSAETIIGTMQLTFIPGFSQFGSKRLLIEAVRVESRYRSHGIGKQMMEWAIERAREKGCATVQLTTHGDRTDAHRFYEKLGFKGTHLGMKLSLK